MLFGTGTDYVLFVSARFREELARHKDRHEAMRVTMRGVGAAVASSGLTILVASAALGLATLRSYQALGPAIAIAVGLMMVARSHSHSGSAHDIWKARLLAREAQTGDWNDGSG